MAQIQLGDAEVGNLGVSVFGDQDVRRLDVTVDYALRVRIVERLGQFFGELERVGKRQFLFTDKNLVQGFAGNEFENNIRTLIVRVLPDVKDGHDAGMVQASGSLCFANKPLPELFFLLGIVPADGERLYRDLPIDLRIARLVHHTHGTPAEFS